MGELIREALEEKLKQAARKLRSIGIVSVEGEFGRRSGDEPAMAEPWR